MNQLFSETKIKLGLVLSEVREYVAYYSNNRVSFT